MRFSVIAAIRDVINLASHQSKYPCLKYHVNSKTENCNLKFYMIIFLYVD